MTPQAGGGSESGDRLDGRHALVCGASKGIGRATALELGRRGARVTGLARSEPELVELAAELRALGAPGPAFVIADLDDRRSLRDAVASLIDVRGPIEVLINNAGGPSPGRLLDATDADILAALSRHLLASHDLVRLALTGMRQGGWGRIVNIVSISVREPLPNLGVLNIVRAAMASWSKTLAMELPPGITINSVLPGYTATERLESLAQRQATAQGVTAAEIESSWASAIPEGRMAEPWEIAAAVGFLASPAASYIRGVALAVDGGRLRTL